MAHHLTQDKRHTRAGDQAGQRSSARVRRLSGTCWAKDRHKHQGARGHRHAQARLGAPVATSAAHRRWAGLGAGGKLLSAVQRQFEASSLGASAR